MKSRIKKFLCIVFTAVMLLQVNTAYAVNYDSVSPGNYTIIYKGSGGYDALKFNETGELTKAADNSSYTSKFNLLNVPPTVGTSQNWRAIVGDLQSEMSMAYDNADVNDSLLSIYTVASKIVVDKMTAVDTPMYNGYPASSYIYYVLPVLISNNQTTRWGDINSDMLEAFFKSGDNNEWNALAKYILSSTKVVDVTDAEYEKLVAVAKTERADSSYVAQYMLDSSSDTNTAVKCFKHFFLKGTTVDAVSDNKQAVSEIGPSKVDNSAVDSAIENETGLTQTEWNNWYTAADKIACGITPEDPGWKLDDEYKESSNLLDKADSVSDKQEFWRRAVDVMALAYSKGENNVGDWDKDKASLKKAVQGVKGTGQLVNGVSTYQSLVDSIADVEASNPDQWVKRMATFKMRMEALYHIATLSGVDYSDDNYSWVTNYYENTPSNISIPQDLFDASDKNIPTLLAFSGKTLDGGVALVTDYPNVPDDGEPTVLPYMLETIWEMPYLTVYMGKDINEAIKNSTVTDHQAMYNGLKAIKESVDEMGIPLMQTLWSKEYDEVDGDYKSLEKMWQKCQEDPAIKAENEAADTQLTTGKPLPNFFKDYTKGVLSDNYIKALAYTSVLSPMKSNVYSNSWRSMLDDNLKSQFYDLWGFNRKALYRDKTSDAGLEYYTSGKDYKGDTDVCTLRDFLDSNGDLVLYLDSHFYNANKLQQEGNITPSYAVNENGTDVWYGNLSSSIEDAYNTSFENIVKTGADTHYSKVFYKMMDKVSGSHVYYPEATEANPGNQDNIVLSSGKINYYLNYGDTGSEVYSPLQSYAVVSAIYRDGDLFDLTNKKDVTRPVFVSSKKAAYAKNASMEQKMTLFNYALVRNIKAAMPVGYVGSLDMDCPLYMDILGNIVTESGVVVVPAMSNATIMSHSSYYKSLWAAGLFTVYGLDYKIPVKSNDASTIGDIIDGIFEPDEAGKYYVPVARTLGDNYTIDMSRLTVTSQSTIQILYERAYADLVNSVRGNDPLYDFNSYFQICMEVLRGAPIENIDKEVEGLNTSSRMDKAGIVAAAKLEELNKSLGTNGENTTIAMPNIAFMQGFNYAALIAFKILLLVVLVVNMVTIYYDAVSEQLNIVTAGKCLWAMILTIVVIVTVPALFNLTYYQSNRSLLQNEASYISMLNMEKSESGVEVGVTSIDDPDIKTVLYLKLEDINIPWYDLFYNSVHTDSYKTLNAMYEDYAQTHSSLAYRDDVDIKNDGVYVNVNTIYSSSSVDIDTTSSGPNAVNLTQTAENNTSAFSFYSPYYSILDALIRNVNYFNAHPWEDGSNTSTQGWYSYQTKTQRGGKLKTMGLIEPYLSSSRFMEDDAKDPLGLKAVYANITNYDYLPDDATSSLYNDANIDSMKNSYWYPEGMQSVEVAKRIKYLTDEARKFVADNKDLLGKISDETFLKVMAMDIAVKHNRIFGCKYASAYEIANLSSDDLVRLSIAKRSDVVLNSALSYPRFVYAVGETPAVFAAAMLSMILWISGIVKPILVVLAFLTVFVSIFVFKVCMRKSDVSVYGYIITSLLLALTNVAYSLLLKLSLYLPSLGLTPFMCILIQIVIQIAYLVLLLSVVWTAFRDWRDLGFARYANKMHDWKINLSGMFHKGAGGNKNYDGSSRQSDPEKNWNYYDNLLDERNRRGR